MGSLKKCLKKIGIPEHEAAILRGEVKDYLDDGYAPHEAAVRAMKGYIESLAEERADVVKQLAEKGVRIADVAGVQNVIDEAANEAATSPQNDLPQPTKAQKEAGNYTKGHVTISGLNISIENPAGSKRRPEWPVLKSHYGYLKGTIGKDKDHIDVFIKPGTPTDYTGQVFVVDQTNKDGGFDEHKVMLGWDNEKAARAGYLENYTNGWKGLGAITETSIDDFKAWLADGDTKKRFAPQAVESQQEPAKAQAATTAEQDTGLPILARLATEKERMGGKPLQRGYESIPEKEGYEVVYKPYGNSGEKSGAGYYYAPQKSDSGAATAPASGVLDSTAETPEAAYDTVVSAPAAEYPVKEDENRYQTDLFGDKLPDQDWQREKAPVSRNIRSATAVRSLEVKDKNSGTFAVETVLVSERSRTIPVSKIVTIDDAATAFAYLYNYAVEHFDAIVTDKNGKPLAVVGSFKGTLNAAAVYPTVVVHEAFRIKGAANLWLSHNHPSGLHDLSRADEVLHDSVMPYFKGSKITLKGLFAIGDGGYTFRDSFGGLTSGDIKKPGAGSETDIPVIERVFKKNERLGAGISSPIASQSVIPSLSNGQAGMVLLDNRNRPVAFVPVSKEEAGMLRTKGRMDRLYRALSTANAASAIIANPNETYSSQEWRNLAGFLNSQEVRALDTINYTFDSEKNTVSDVSSMSDRGFDHNDKIFFDRQTRVLSKTPGLSVEAVRKVTDTIAAKWTNAPQVNAVQSVSQLPDYLYKALRAVGGENDTRGLFDPQTDHVWLIADNIKSQQVAQSVLLHESLGHYGLRETFGKDIEPILNQVYMVYGNRGLSEIAGRYGLDLSKKKDRLIAAEEMLAHIAQTGEKPSLVAKIVQFIKDWLRRNGFTIQMSESDVRGLVARMGQSVERGQAREAAGRDGQPLQARGPDESNKQGSEGRAGLFGMEYTGPLDMAVKAIVKVTKFDRATTYLHDVIIKEKIGSLIPEKIKAGIVDRYGVPVAVQDMRNQVKINTFKAIRETGTLVERIASIGREESQVLHTIMSSDDQIMTDYLSDRLSNEGKEFITDTKSMIASMTREAIDVGLISEDAALRNKNAYVHRSYKKYTNFESDKTEIATRTRAMRIMGETSKGRGMRQDVSMEALQIATKSWWTRKVKAAGDVDTALKGEKFIRLERRAPLDDRTKTLSGIPESDKKGRLLEVRYWPVGEPIPEGMKNWDQDIVPWEARFFDKSKQVGMWRDFAPAERALMGEIDEVKYITAKTIILMAHDIEVAKYFKWVGTEYGKSVLPAGVKPVEGSELLRHAYKPDDWVRVPGTKIPGTNLQVYGHMADKYLPGPIWNDIRQISRMRSQNVLPDALAKIIRMWKLSKTVLTPGVHTNNIMGNVMMADWHDVLARHTAKALMVLWQKSKNDEYAALYKDFEASGATLGMYANEELRSEIMEPLEEGLREELRNAKDELGSSLSISGILSLVKNGHIAAAAGESLSAAKDTKAYEKAAKVVGAAIDAYQIEDAVFRLAAFIKAKEDGMTDAQAGKFAKGAFLDYDITAPWINALRQTILPFIAFQYRAIPMMAETVAHKPWKVMKLMLIAGSLNSLAYAMLGDDGDEDKERAVLPPEKNGRIWGIIPKLVRMPGNYKGEPVFLDIRRWVVVGDVLDIGMTHSAIPLLPVLNPAGPLQTMAELVLNRTSFTGKAITKETDTTKEATLAVIDHLYKSFAPNIPGLPGTYATRGIWNAGTGKTDDFGRELSLPMAMLSSVGVKIAAYPRDAAIQNIASKHSREKSEIEAKIFGIQREYRTHGINEEQFNIKMEYQINKLRNLDKELILSIGE